MDKCTNFNLDTKQFKRWKLVEYSSGGLYWQFGLLQLWMSVSQTNSNAAHISFNLNKLKDLSIS